MATLPYMQLHFAEYLADTVHLKTDEHGAYLLLMINYWQTEKPLPISRLQAITRLSDERWTDVERTLSELFIVDTEKGIWNHKRIDIDIEKVKERSRKNSLAGKKSAKSRIEKAIDNKGNFNDRSTTVQHKSNDRSTNKEKREKSKEKRVNIKDKIHPEKLNLPAWKEYIQHRIDMKIKPLSLRGEEKKIEELCKYSKEHQQRTVNATIGSGWQGLFPDKQPASNKSASGAMLDTLTNT